jgi:CO dehydrogenase/acetyl-CoA synthase beta subunit
MEEQRWEEPEKRREDKISEAKRREAEEEEEEEDEEEEEEKRREEDQKKERVRGKKMHVREKSRAGGPNSTLAIAAGAEPSGQMRDLKLHAVVARCTFRSQNVQNTSASEHF